MSPCENFLKASGRAALRPPKRSGRLGFGAHTDVERGGTSEADGAWICRLCRYTSSVQHYKTAEPPGAQVLCKQLFSNARPRRKPTGD